MNFPPIAKLLPHEPPMVLLDSVVAYGDDWIECSVSPTADGLFVADGSVPNAVALEYMAQAVAALAGLGHHLTGRAPRVGYLIASRRCVLYASELRLGETLSVRARSVWQDAGAGHFECSVDSGATRVADASLTVYEPPLAG